MNNFRKFAAAAFAAASLVAVGPAVAELAPGNHAPDFTTQGARAGKPVTVNLANALKKGPVVLYFFPAAFTPGCNAEAHAFAEKMKDFTAAGATVIGMTAGNTDQLEKFSAEKCAGQFTVASASPAVVKEYDVVLKKPDGSATSYTNRTTYVIDRKGNIVDAYTNMSPIGHISRSLAAVQKLHHK
ncbi:redoxin domain-containing protein [Porphyrobacter algicida]|uniref:thioredoxin-dependent peroxiredoxin n=1 Tax=Qipengyuania algicida TaxID=1836209 RepID=A0A845AGM9_9SPHN|nr:peroxiredoxin [Qipengyuania algicida]MXP28579.1 redoxin domain-containing protein [Qipengyuania algicida]